MFFFANLTYAETDLSNIIIEDRKPINSPITGYNPDINSYPDPFHNDEILFTIDKNNYLELQTRYLPLVKLKCSRLIPKLSKCMYTHLAGAALFLRKLLN